MSGNANNQEHSQARDAALSSLYHAGEQHEPPEHLDDEILAAARKEVRAGPRRRTRIPTSSPWFIPMATAAVLVLSVSVVFLARQQTPELADASRIAKLATPSEQRTPNEPAAAGAMADSAAQLKKSDEPRVARFIGSKRETAAGVSSSVSVPTPVYATPDDWLKEIARLQHIGEKQLAEAELKRFSEINTKISATEIDMKLEKYRHELSGAAVP